LKRCSLRAVCLSASFLFFVAKPIPPFPALPSRGESAESQLFLFLCHIEWQSLCHFVTNDFRLPPLPALYTQALLSLPPLPVRSPGHPHAFEINFCLRTSVAIHPNRPRNSRARCARLPSSLRLFPSPTPPPPDGSALRGVFPTNLFIHFSPPQVGTLPKLFGRSPSPPLSAALARAVPFSAAN